MSKILLVLALVLTPTHTPPPLLELPRAVAGHVTSMTLPPASPQATQVTWTDTFLPLTVDVVVDPPLPTAPSEPPIVEDTRDAFTVMMDRLAALEGEWTRPIWDCISLKESHHSQYLVGPTLDRGFLQITDFWWFGGFGRIGRPELMFVDPYDPLNQANGADAIWQRNGQRWIGQWVTARACGVG